MKKFDLPEQYVSSTIKEVQNYRNQQDPRKKDFRPTLLSYGSVEFILSRSFGFCYGVENAIERSYRAITENPGKNIYLLSQMIHNPDVNDDLLRQGMRFIMDTKGNQLISWDEITSDDIVIIPAFGTSIETKEILKEKGVEFLPYDTTCPFVTRVWKRAEQLGKKDYNLIIHGKYEHEETRATFSHSLQNAEAIVIKNMNEAQIIADFITQKITEEELCNKLEGKMSDGFIPSKHLLNVGVINQTTMLATETAEISDFLENAYKERFGDDFRAHFANTRDTLCYATNENQDATISMLDQKADLAIVVGGYNSSNTSHLVELCEEKLATYYICNTSEIKENQTVNYFHFREKQMDSTPHFLPKNKVPRIMLTSGASCPDTILEEVLNKILSFYPKALSHKEAIENIKILD
ncbi:MAG: 4-hydroxy-3-methylbut-2-enyl diphosphate reductase [Flavobacteriales bacterium]|jgi:4-hydroxy-3-methylbut-2-enyl diphosphate reductase|nr:4-hydroxy-3-methylbut-2-enyl diphosphate reductase [Flavobacteriales bacterium]